MNLPNHFLNELKEKIEIAELIGAKVTWDQKKTRPPKGDFWAPCPFHSENTASFHVDNQKGFYYCFGCQAKGDCFKFVQETEAVTFIEAVKILAHKAGMALPKQTEKAKAEESRREKLYKIMESTIQFYKLQLKTVKGQAARNYLENRNISEDTASKFEIGFSPIGSDSLLKHLIGKGYSEKDINDVGLSVKRDDENISFDRFRNRLMFPIRNLQGNPIAFGGRSLIDGSHAKYLNSPETVLFDKSSTVYNIKQARSEAKSANTLIVVEGYMDVLSLSQAGMKNVVAPLGTAVTSKQLEILWRLSPEPIVAFDGDTAGERAAFRLLYLALPLVKASKSLRFCIMPSGQDPDDIVSSSGLNGMSELIKSALPLVDLLWKSKVNGKIFDSPERKALLDIELKRSLKDISDNNLRNYFRMALSEKKAIFFKQYFNKSSEKNGRYQRSAVPKKFTFEQPVDSTKKSLLAYKPTDKNVENRTREGAILIGAINHPQIALELEQDLCETTFTSKDLSPIRDALVAELPNWKSDENVEILDVLMARLKFDPLQKVNKASHLHIHPHLKKSAEPELAKMAMEDLIKRQKTAYRYSLELREAEKNILTDSNEELTNRLKNANETMRKVKKGNEQLYSNTDEIAKYHSSEIESLIKNKVWIKKK